MIKRWILFILLVAVTSTSAFGQQSSPPSGESHKHRTILTLAGGGGGFAVGLFAGLAAFDDATNSDRKVWTTAILAGVGGAIGGYFLGRALDGRSKAANVTWKSDAFEQSLVRGRWPTPWIDQTLKAGQHSGLKNLPGSRLAEKGSVNQASNSAPSLDTNYLYLVSVAKRLKVALGGWGGWGEPRQVAIITVGVWKNLEQSETSRQTALPTDTSAQ